MSDTDELNERIELCVDELLAVYDIDRPPVPVELMLQRPRDGMWKEIDLSEMSASFLNLFDRHAPRMSAVRFLARTVARSEWGKERGLDVLLTNPDTLRRLARAIIIPRAFLENSEVADKTAISLRFEVPEEDAETRLGDLGW
jgi:hypothetical protein